MPKIFTYYGAAGRMKPLLVIFLVAIVGPLVFCQGVWTQQHGGKFATSLCAELITPNGYNCIEYRVSGAVTKFYLYVSLDTLLSEKLTLNVQQE